jgi:carboxyl-terminal processing protease
MLRAHHERHLAALRAGLLVSIGVLLALVASQVRERWFRGDRERLQDALDEVTRLVDERYVYPLEPRQLVENAIAGMLDGLDEHSHYFPAEESRRVERETSGTYHGIGAVFAPGTDQLQFLFPLPESPAARVGVEPGERIATIDGAPVESLSVAERRARLTNDRGEAVRLGLVARDGREREVEIVPEEVGDPSVRHAQIVDAQAGVGYLAITSFSRRTPAEFDLAVGALRSAGARALILDLRGNPGGVLRSAVRVAGRFVGAGTIVSSHSRTRVESWDAEPGEDWYAGLPLVVLVDRDSASASEVVAGALQDHRVCALVGERTYGKGCVQTLTPLDALGIDGIVKLTTSVYRTPSGRLIERTLPGAWAPGLAPDLDIGLDDAERTTLSQFLMRYSPPFEHRAALEAWQAEQPEREILPRLPRDAQFEAALGLLRGVHPGPSPS